MGIHKKLIGGIRRKLRFYLGGRSECLSTNAPGVLPAKAVLLAAVAEHPFGDDWLAGQRYFRLGLKLETTGYAVGQFIIR